MQRRDLETFLGVLADAWSVSDMRDMPWFVSRTLQAFIRCDSVWGCVFPVSKGRSRATRIFADPEDSLPGGSAERSLLFGTDNRLVTALLQPAGTRVVRLSDAYPRQQQTASIVVQTLARLNVSHQAGLSLCVNQNRVGVYLLNRCAGNFTRAEVAILTSVQATLQVLYEKSAVWDLIEHIDCESLTRLEDIGLSLRERHVLYWIANGKRNDEVSRILAISVRTVEKHLEHIYAKLGVETRGAAVSRAHQLGVTIKGGDDRNAYHRVIGNPDRYPSLETRRRRGRARHPRRDG